MNHTQFYDRVMQQVEVGHARNALIQLSGMLDASGMNSGGLAAAGDALRRHDLFALLRRAQCPEPDTSTSAIPTLLRAPSLLPSFDPTAQMLFTAMREIPPVHAILKRGDHAGRIIAQAWKEGRSICLSGTGYSDALRILDGRDLGNVTVCGASELPRAAVRQRFDTLADALEAGACFDLIYAPDLLFETAQDRLAETFSAVAASLTADGTALMSSLLPDHLGSGWRKLCLAWEPHCHAEEPLAHAAQAAGVTARFYDDREGCILWCEVACAQNSKAKTKASQNQEEGVNP